MKIHFGKHVGKDLVEIPTSYLKWLDEREIGPPLRKAVEEEIKAREASESSIGRNIESPSFTTYEEMVHRSLMQWMVIQISAGKIIIPQEHRETFERGLYARLKEDLPKCKKLYRSQTNV